MYWDDLKCFFDDDNDVVGYFVVFEFVIVCKWLCKFCFCRFELCLLMVVVKFFCWREFDLLREDIYFASFFLVGWVFFFGGLDFFWWEDLVVVIDGCGLNL